MGVDKRCVGGGKALQVESAASEIQGVKMHLRKTLQNQANACTKDGLRQQVRYKSIATNFNQNNIG